MPERGRHGMAPWGHFAMPWLFVYPYTFISILLSVLLYIYIATLSYWCIDVLLYCFISTLSYICIALFISIWIYRNINISILVLFPFASSLHARCCCVWRNMAKLPRSKDALHSRAARERGRTFHQGRCEQHLIHATDAAHFPGCHQKVRLVLFLRSWTLHELHWENEAYFLPLPHGL